MSKNDYRTLKVCDIHSTFAEFKIIALRITRTSQQIFMPIYPFETSMSFIKKDCQITVQALTQYVNI